MEVRVLLVPFRAVSTARCSLTIRSQFTGTHDVAAACRLAGAEARVRLPLGAVEERCRGAAGRRVGKSENRRVGKFGNPRASGARDRRFESDRADLAPRRPDGATRLAAPDGAAPASMRRGPCWYGQAAVNRPDAGSIPAAAARPMCAEFDEPEESTAQAGLRSEQNGSHPAG